jgi:hypothetical protein
MIAHGFARFLLLDALGAAQRRVTVGEIIEIFAGTWIDNAHPHQRDIRSRSGDLDLVAITQKDGHPQPQRVKLPCSLQHSRLRAFRENNSLRVPLQLLEQSTDKTHGMSVPEKQRRRNSIALYSKDVARFQRCLDFRGAAHTIRRMRRILFLGLLISCAVAHGANLKLVAEGFTSPTVLVPLGDGSGRLLIADQLGTIHVLNKDGKLSEQLFLDLRGKLTKLNQGFDERGVLGVALHPKFKDNRKFYVYYSAPRRKEAPPILATSAAGRVTTNQFDHTSHVSEFKVRDNDVAQADPASERLLLQIDKPQFNHNCGRLVFGPDGFLYIGVGDGGGGNDFGPGHSPQGNGQDLTKHLGKILRIDVDNGQPYGVPTDNPFASGGEAKPEIFAYGLRNPWGISFDRGGSHEMFASDVGQDAWEEVNIITKGGNYGWRIREGFDCFDPKNSLKPPADCAKVGADGKPLIEPILVYKNFKRFANDPEAKGISVTGGYVYRGKAIPDLVGKYVFGDWSRAWVNPDGVLFAGTRGADKKWSLETLPVKVSGYVVAFGQDDDGELYVLTTANNSLKPKTGKVFKLTP